MKDQITQEQVDAYRKNGFVAIENFYDAQEIAEWREAVNAAVQRRLDAVEQGLSTGQVKRSLTSRLKGPLRSVIGQGMANAIRSGARKVLGDKIVPIGFNGVLNTNQGDKDSYYAQVYIQCIRLAAESEAVRKLVCDPRVGKAIATLNGIDGVRLYHDQALYKPTFGNPTAWHLDNPYWSFSSRQASTMWIALEDATMANGCMWYVPGSHLTATEKNLGIGEDFAGLMRLYPQWKSIDPVACPCPAGSVVIHNGLTAHGAGVNMTSRPRRAFACAFMPEGSIFNGNKDVLPDDYFKSLHKGDLLNNDALHPLIWSNPDRTKVPRMAPAVAGAAA